ncbi:hypothetical protein AMS68_004920 [Peltaster fructicola]|uniref:HD domain-containing protein n=1 Tax=Peltaster fructicola TaxID=286661 RepID=A0A6H0XXC4_9PEZI|nr:hypothetical protein AMS68_004920 [Peltaster fructicola]
MSAPEQVVDEVVHMLNTRGQGDYIGEAISQLQHSLQAAHLAAVSHAQDKVVIAALLHDIGHFLPLQEASRLAGEIKDMHNEADNTSVGRIGHERIGELYLLHKGFSPDIAALVGSHVAAKRFLCAVEPAYHDTLSDASKKSLIFQGGPMNAEEVKQWSAQPWCADMCRLRKWDDAAKVPELVVPAAESYRDMLLRSLLSS